MRTFRLAFVLGVIGCSGTAAAQTITFDPATACAPGPCSSPSRISQGYDQPNIDLSYRVVTGVGSSQTQTSVLNGQTIVVDTLTWYDTGFGDLRGAAYAPSGNGTIGTQAGEIRFDVQPGYRLTLNSADLAGFGGSFASQINIFDLSYNLLFSNVGFIAPGSGRTTVSLGNISSSAGLILHFGPEGYDVGIDNISYALESIAAVPEPATWAMMIGGMGVIGCAMRRRRARTMSFA